MQIRHIGGTDLRVSSLCLVPIFGGYLEGGPDAERLRATWRRRPTAGTCGEATRSRSTRRPATSRGRRRASCASRAPPSSFVTGPPSRGHPGDDWGVARAGSGAAAAGCAPVRALVLVAPVTITVRGFAVEVKLGKREGLPRPYVVSCDWLVTVPKVDLLERAGALDGAKLAQLDDALRFALGLDAA